MSNPKQKTSLTDYDLFVENADLNQGNYPVEAIQDWGNYKTVRTPSNQVYLVDDIRAGKYTGTVPAYISDGRLIAGSPRAGFPSETITDNQEAYKVYKNAVGDYYNTEYASGHVADAVTGGVFHRLSPTQNARLLYDVATGGDWRNSMIYGNNGVVSDQFAVEHPYWTTAINFAGDAAAFNAGNISKMLNPTRLIANGRASYSGPTPVVGQNGVYMLSTGESVPEYQVIVQNGRGVSPRAFGTGRGQITYGNPREVNIPSKHGSPGYKGSGKTKVSMKTVSNPSAVVSNSPVVADNYKWNPAIPQWLTKGAIKPTYTTEDVNIVGTPYHNEVIRNFHDDEWIKKFQATPEGGVFWHNGKSYIKQTGGRDRFVRESYNNGQTPWGNSATQVYFDRGVPVVEVPWGTPTGITRITGEDTGNIDYNKAVNRTTGKSEKSKAKGK